MDADNLTKDGELIVTEASAVHATLPVGQASDFPSLFPYEIWESKLEELAEQYRSNPPFPNIHLSNFLREETARKVMAEFPRPGETTWIHYKHFNENTMGKVKRAEFPPLLGKLVDELNTPRFVGFLSKLIGIPDLVSDPMLEGGGMHQTKSGGFLNVHADFNMHHYHTNWRRRCNLILYLNEDWKAEWGGALELWDAEMRKCVRKIEPLLNHAVIFNTGQISFHGYPDPITCPPDVTRKSLALYYYTVEENTRQVARSTSYQARPGDGIRSIFIWLDSKAIHIYSLIKKRLGLSDDFASKVLVFFSKKK
jgi:hypothetical protein